MAEQSGIEQEWLEQWEHELTPGKAIERLSRRFGTEAERVLWHALQMDSNHHPPALCRTMRLSVEHPRQPFTEREYRNVSPGWDLWPLLADGRADQHELLRAVHAVGGYIYRSRWIEPNERSDGSGGYEVVETREMIDLRIASSFVDGLLRGDASKRGRPLGSGTYANADEPLLRQMDELIAHGKALSAHDAARQIAHLAGGGGSPDSKVSRLVKHYKKWKIVGE